MARPSRSAWRRTRKESRRLVGSEGHLPPEVHLTHACVDHLGMRTCVQNTQRLQHQRPPIALPSVNVPQQRVRSPQLRGHNARTVAVGGLKLHDSSWAPAERTWTTSANGRSVRDNSRPQRTSKTVAQSRPRRPQRDNSNADLGRHEVVIVVSWQPRGSTARRSAHTTSGGRVRGPGRGDVSEA